MDEIVLNIPGKPIAKKRHRIVHKTGHIYDPNAKDTARVITQCLIPQSRGYEIFTGALFVKFEFVFKRPKSHYGTGRNKDKLKKSAPVFCNVVQDFDNLEKFVCDAMNTVIYGDDRQIVQSMTWKRWGSVARSLITVRQLEE